jgi:hypothetical protein
MGFDDRDLPRLPLLPDDSSRNVTAKAAEYSEPRVADHQAPPTTTDDAIKLAIKLAVDAGEYERAAALLDVAKRSARPATVTAIASARPGKQ